MHVYMQYINMADFCSQFESSIVHKTGISLYLSSYLCLDAKSSKITRSFVSFSGACSVIQYHILKVVSV
jgi:hypothetical protein